MDKITLENYKINFSEKWINELHNQYYNMLNNSGVINMEYFSQLGEYDGKNDRCIDTNISDFFKRLLYVPNIAVLDYVIKNISNFTNLIFLDNRSGFGLLSIFLNKINIVCYNFDNFCQLGKVTFDNKFFNNYNIK